jgi:PAS domain S-box-containing protein
MPTGASVDSIALRVHVPGSLTDLAGLLVDAEDFLAAVLETAAQPIWVVDPDGVIRFANPAAIAALGYDSADELSGRHSHETIHHSRPDGTPYPASECRMLLPRARGETVASDLDWFFRRDGSMFPVSYVSAPIEMPDGRGAVVAFTDIEDRLHAEELRSEHEAILAAREASLRRIAALVAGGAASAEVFAAIAREVAGVLGVSLVAVWRYESDGTGTVVGAWSEPPHLLEVGSRWPLDDTVIISRVRETGHPARSDDLADVHGTVGDIVRQAEIRSAAGAPIIVDGDVWGVMAAGATEGERLPDRIEDRLAGFTELVATTISNSASREQLARLADEQAALRRVATLVARGVSPSVVFAAVAREVGLLLGVDATHMARYELDGTATGVAAWSVAGDHKPVGTRVGTAGESIVGIVLRTGRPARMHGYENASGPAAALGRELGLRSSVGAPIVVDQRLWGVMIVSSKHDRPLPVEMESRIAAFTELVAMAISNTEAREELAASREELATSRARIVAATDDERRRVVRDLHDGAQQRLVHTIVTLKLARRAIQNGDGTATALVTQALEHAQRATDEVRELAHGILPAVLTRGGLRAGVNALAARMPVPIKSNVSVGRLPAGVEATAYFVVAEALTNVAKHARANGATVLAGVEDRMLRVRVRDDGVGGARHDGSGLVGLADRLAVLDGRLRVESPADGGTLVAADIPLPD